MLDGRYKAVQDRFWDRVARPIASTGISPNALTLLGTLLVVASALAYVGHGRAWLLGVSVAVCEMLDNLDGAVARVAGRATRFGAYLDAITDRYKETAIFTALAVESGDFAPAFFCVTGSLLTSYAKARACMEAPLDQVRWPDFFERFERMAILCTGLVVSAFVPTLLGRGLVSWTLVVIALGSHASALQRLHRARALLARYDAGDQTR